MSAAAAIAKSVTVPTSNVHSRSGHRTDRPATERVVVVAVTKAAESAVKALLAAAATVAVSESPQPAMHTA